MLIFFISPPFLLAYGHILTKLYHLGHIMSIDMKILIVDRIKHLMETEEISQYALAKKLGISQSTICNWLNGKKEPSIENLWKLADYFGETIDFLVGREN